MNIIVKPYGGDLCHCRPDTTWERENRDFYSPECVNEILWNPVIFARISKAGKCVSPKFIERYYDAVGCGMLMYGVTATSSAEGASQISSCIDHSSILPMPLYNPVVIEDDKEFTVTAKKADAADSAVTSVVLGDAKALLEDAICKASQLTSLRIGDYVAVELGESKALAGRTDGEVAVKGNFCENEIFDFKIIF
jgi:hypothetical protein